MSNYPEWVLAHKSKGTYINKVGDKYYLYAAHSERVPGTKKIRRVCDGYLGRITQEQGLIPPKQKFLTHIRSYEYGLSSLILVVCANIHKGFRRSFVVYGDFVMAAASLTFIYGFYSHELFCSSWLSLHFSGSPLPDSLTPEQETGIQRGALMIADTMLRKFGDTLPQVRAYFPLVTLLSVGKQFYCAEIPAPVQELVEQYSLDWRSDLWQK